MMGYEAMELLTTGWCPLKCSYCYIPKTAQMKRLHLDIVRRIKGKKLLEEITRVPGGKRHLGFWGTEPTLTLRFLGEQLAELKEICPDLKDLSFSTNMLIDPKIIVDFLASADKVGIESVKVQVSIDGPAFITDVNRAPGATEKIVENLHKFVELLNESEVNLKVVLHWKATLTINNIREMNEHPELIHEYFHFFNKLTSELAQKSKKQNLEIQNSSGPTLVVPGKYTSEDGRELAKFFKLLAIHKYPNTYVYRALRVFKYRDELYKTRMFTCSGGDSNIGFDGEHIHICHRSFYLDRDEYVESVLEMPEYQNWDVSHFKRGSIKNIQKYYIVEPEDEMNLARFQYVMRGYHDFWKMKLASTYAMIKELALAGQASKIYLENDKMAEMLALFINTALSCPMENLLNTGSIHIPPISLIRLFGNGAFEIIIDEARKNVSRRK